MAIRYCGAARIRIRWDDAANAYRYTVTTLEGKATGYVGNPACGPMRAVDCPESYDDAAHAAVSFAYTEGLEGFAPDHADHLGWKIERRKP